MQVINQLNSELVSYLDVFKDWVFLQQTQNSIKDKIKWINHDLKDLEKSEEAASLEYLKKINHHTHDGFPPEMYGVDLNYDSMKKHGLCLDPQFFEEVREINFKTDDLLQTYLGAKLSALKAFYPEDGYIAWHTNWNAPGYNIIFTYSPNGNGYWRHIDPQSASSYVPDENNLVHIQDKAGWNCKAGYFGTKEEVNKLVWHSAYTKEPRVTLAYVLYDEQIWKNLIEEIQYV